MTCRDGLAHTPAPLDSFVTNAQLHTRIPLVQTSIHVRIPLFLHFLRSIFVLSRRVHAVDIRVYINTRPSTRTNAYVYRKHDQKDAHRRRRDAIRRDGTRTVAGFQGIHRGTGLINDSSPCK